VWDERRRSDDLVTIRSEIIEERTANIVGGSHRQRCRRAKAAEQAKRWRSPLWRQSHADRLLALPGLRSRLCHAPRFVDGNRIGHVALDAAWQRLVRRIVRGFDVCYAPNH